MNTFQAVIFDFDGVILDSQRFWDEEVVHVYQQIIPSWTEADDKQQRGRNVHDIYPLLVERYGLTLSKDEFVEHIENFALSIYTRRADLVPGIRELVALCQDAKLPMGIASSSPILWIQSALERHNLDDTFDPIVTAQEVGKGKPDPAVYVEAARRLGIDPKDCVAIEDSKNGVASAKAAGMTCIGLQHLKSAVQDDLSAADRIVTSLREITLPPSTSSGGQSVSW